MDKRRESLLGDSLSICKEPDRGKPPLKIVSEAQEMKEIEILSRLDS